MSLPAAGMQACVSRSICFTSSYIYMFRARMLYTLSTNSIIMFNDADDALSAHVLVCICPRSLLLSCLCSCPAIVRPLSCPRRVLPLAGLGPVWMCLRVCPRSLFKFFNFPRSFQIGPDYHCINQISKRVCITACYWIWSWI